MKKKNNDTLEWSVVKELAVESLRILACVATLLMLGALIVLMFAM